MNNHTQKTESKSGVGRRVLLLLATVITALAVAVTCALTIDTSRKVSVTSVSSAGVSTSGNYTNLTGDTLKNYIANGSFTTNNYVEYSYNGGSYQVNLPAGTYKYEVWGARGGNTGSYAANSGNANGGYGGYAYGQITYTAASTTIYIYVGGNGAGAVGTRDQNHTTRAGGYNGGGNGIGSRCGGGGGATDIRTVGGACSTASSYNSRILIAGGGGGGEATGTTQKHVSCGTLWQGASGCTSRHNSNYFNDESGGGGGYYGGDRIHGDDPYSSYCGSNFVSSVFISGTTGNSYGNTGATGNGKARITAINVNQAPVSLNKTVTLSARTGGTISTAVAASALAADNDNANHANATLTGVYFTNGASDRDTFTTTANANLFVNSACSKTASEYFTWTWGTDKKTLTFTKVLKFPRAGYDGVTTNGTIKLYVRIRDNFGTSGTARAFAVIPFTVTVQVTTISQRTNAAADVVTATTTQTGGNKLYFGLSKTATAPTGSTIDTTNIYNPLGTNRYTAIFSQPLRYNVPVKINASDLIKGFSNTSQDKIVASLNSVSAIGSGGKFKIDEYTSNSAGIAAYNASKSKLPYVYETLSFRCATPDPAYQVFTVTVYQVEKTPVSAMGLTNVEANVTPNAGGKTAMTVDIVFKMDNTRPVMRTNVVPLATVTTLAKQTFSLNTYYTDIDGTNGAISSATHVIKEVVVPTYEYVLSNKYGEIQSTEVSGKTYFNAYNGAAASAFTNVINSGQLNGDANATGFNSTYISNGSTNTDVAFVQYAISNDTITLTGLRATYSLYKSNRTSRSATNTGTFTSSSLTGVTVKTNVANAGHFYILLHIQDKNDTADNGIWLPLGIQVNNVAPTTMQTERGVTGASEMPTANGNKGQVFYFTPMGITINQQVYPVGMYKDSNNAYTSTGLKPIAADADNYFRTNMLNGNSITQAGQTSTGKLNELVKISSSISQIQSSIADNASGYYFSVEFIDIYIPTAYFGGRVTTSGLTTENIGGIYGTCAKIQGLKITLNNWTHNRFLHLEVKVRDSASTTDVSTYIAVNVSNKAPQYLESSKVAQFDYTVNGVTVNSTYTAPSDSTGVATIKYSVPAFYTIIITPYDLITDENMVGGIDRFTLNGLSGKFDSANGLFTVGTGGSGTAISALANEADRNFNYLDPDYVSKLFGSSGMIPALQKTHTFTKLTANNKYGSATSGSTPVEGLYFARTNDGTSLDGFTFNPYTGTNAARKALFAAPVFAGDGYVDYSFGSVINYSGKNYNLDYVVISTNRRTAAGSPAVFEFSVRDRTGASASGAAYGVKKIRVEIDVINSSPKVGNQDNVYTLSTDPTGTSTTTPSTREISASGILVDNEDSDVWFDISGGFQVVDKNDATGSEVDFAGRAYNGYYVNVTLSASQITIVALNSTQAIEHLYIRFYATDGRYGENGLLETSVCYIRIQVMNASFDYNTGENGFEKVAIDNINYQYLWNVESITAQDKTRTRYFVSGNGAASAVRTEYGAASGQIKYLTTDSDALQGVVLSAATSPSSNPDNSSGYINANLTAADKVAAYRNAVPQLGNGNFSAVGTFGAILSIRTGLNAYNGVLTGKVDTDNSDIIYFVNDGSGYTAYKAKTLLSSGNFGEESFRKKFFDDQGRWIVTDWAIVVSPLGESTAGEYINLRISMRDETKLGGGTAGIPTAYKATSYKLSEKVNVNGTRLMEYDMFINGIGIVPLTYYNQFDGYYTVADLADSNKIYVPTYDGTTDSQYDADTPSLYYDASSRQILTNGTTDQLLKLRDGSAADNSLAGVHSGMEYSRANINSTNGYTFSVREHSAISDRVESAFKYSDTIQISGDGAYTYIPMSYFALDKAFYKLNDATGVISFDANSYVSYDVSDTNGNPVGYDRFSGYNSAVIISDGVSTWNGAQSNPYVDITYYDLGRDANSTDVTNLNNSPYLNNRLSIPTYTADGKAETFVSKAKANGYADDIVGANGRLLYLGKQADISNGLQEHLFGLKIRKKNTRSQASALTITIKVAKCSYTGGKTIANYGEGSATAKAQNTAEITLKLEIGNSPINLKAANNGVVQNSEVGYYTELLNLTTDSPTQYLTLSRNAAVDGATKVIQYVDNDIAYKEDGSGQIDESKSDIAKFSYNSLRQLQYLAGYQRVKQLTPDSENQDITFVNVSQDGTTNTKYAQISIKNYLNAWSKSSVDGISSTYRPNSGIYAYNNNEGYDKYFSVGLSVDGSTLSITPKARTTINSDMVGNSNAAEYYAKRGLKLRNPNDPSAGAYYPLKVLIYDDHNDGFGAASYVALEIRVAIAGSAAKLSDSLENYNNVNDGNKQVEVSLSIGQPYTLNMAYVITGGNLIKENNTIFWQADYNNLKAKVADRTQYTTDSELYDDMFKLESGTYLRSPFDNANNIQNYSENSWDLETDNQRLRNGQAVYSSNPSYSGIRSANLPDVIMYMEYYRMSGSTQVKDKLVQNAIPIGNDVSFRVNRRTTYQALQNGVNVSRQQKDFVFELSFTDSDGKTTKKLYVKINVINQTPNIRTKATNAAADFKMQVDDSFTVVTTTYNRFVGSEALATESDYTTPTASARASASYGLVANRAQNNYTGINSPELLKRNADVTFEQLTERNLDTDTRLGLHSYEPNGGSEQHLGYLALADDDTPWGLRLVKVDYYNRDCFEVGKRGDIIQLEDPSISTDDTEYCLDITIKARAVCNNMPVTVTLIDADGALITFTMYVTVVSSKPVAIDYGDQRHKLNATLSPMYETINGMQVLRKGVYGINMISTNVTDNSTTAMINNKSTVTATYKEVTLNNSNTRSRAYGYVRLPIDEIAYDPDSGDVLAMYSEDTGNYNVVTFNNSVMNKNGNVYSNDWFKIEVSSDYTWFTIECKTYNYSSDDDVIKFYVRDSGNNVIENAIPIEIHLCTLYSSITNDYQMTNTFVRQEQFQRGSIASINVKSFDDFSGLSVDKSEEELALLKDKPSTFQFLNYPNMPESVDQTATSAKPINDPDIINSQINRNYTLRIYAFMSNVGESESEFEAVPLESISSFFNLNPTVVNKKVLALKSDDELRNNTFLNERDITLKRFLIGGFYDDGIAMTDVNRSLVLFLQRYFTFEVGDDGVSLEFRPISANIGVDIPLYVQIEKNVGDQRSVYISNTDTVCGDIFYVNVMDSAPIANNENPDALKFAGKVGDKGVFKLYDSSDRYGSLFTDSDRNDAVMFDGYVSAAVQAPDYTKALQKATNQKIDW
ncbi:MAG: hypothetical protein J1F69_05070, partial [Clostridiales bacterium]|nr:hypothetical protein [Clostridiales bacterium]